ncbi:MAG: glucokinase [Planctomycetota bacterium]|nr:glucokinase [Planctomycetota bacterium]
MILAGDIGGTNTRLALVEVVEAGPQRRQFRIHDPDLETFPSAKYAGLQVVIKEFLAKRRVTVSRACVGVAGPVHNGRSAAMNLPWVIDARELMETTQIDHVAVINDLEASAYGISCLGPKDLVTINAGAPDAKGNAAVVSPGTGLGEAGMYWDGQQFHPFATEGGHTDFAPRNKVQYQLHDYLLRSFGHVSYERIVSGPGLVNIYCFLRDTERNEEPAWLLHKMENSDPAATISNAALAGQSLLCEKALDLFLELYGAEAGNVALKFMARGGVWLGGGIVVKVLSRLQTTGGFMAAFFDKGRLREHLEKIPVRAILNPFSAILGAARYASDIAWPS